MFTIVPLTSLVGDWAAGSAPSPQVADDDIWGKVFAGDVFGVEQLLDKGFDPDLRGEPGGWTLLNAAALTGAGRHHLRSASRASRISELGRLVSAAFLRRRISDTWVARGGWEVVRSGSNRGITSW